MGGVLKRIPHFWALAAIVLVRLYLAAIFPIDGDEAYYRALGWTWSLGYYDTPPLLTWFFSLTHQFSDALWVSRIPVILVYPFLGLLAHAYFTEVAPEKAGTVLFLFALLPVSFVPIVTPDLFLALFGFFAALFFVRGFKSGAPRDYAVAGVFFGFAVLSKYIAFLFGMGLVSYALLFERGRRGLWKGIFLFCAVAGSIAAINIAWNYWHCWINFVYQFKSRFVDAPFLKGPSIFFLSQLVLLTPVAFLLWVWRTREFIAYARSRDPSRIFLWMGLLGLGFFFVASVRRGFLLPWTFSFGPLLLMGLAHFLPLKDLRRLAAFFGLLAAVLAGGIVILLQVVPLERLVKDHGRMNLFLLYKEPAEAMASLRPYIESGTFQMASQDFAEAGLGTVAMGTKFVVFPRGTSGGRGDDEAFDYRKLAGKDLLLFSYKNLGADHIRPYFKSVEEQEVKYQGYPYHLFFGRGFDYEAYRRLVLEEVKSKFYDIPRWAPMGGCPFYEKYFPDEYREKYGS